MVIPFEGRISLSKFWRSLGALFLLFMIGCDFSKSPSLISYDKVTEAAKCQKANQEQIDVVNLGNLKRDFFLSQCQLETGNSPWCRQVARPNPASYNVFACTYGPEQPHLFIHPDEKTWNYAIQGVKIVQDLERQGISVCLIYNWWRPEPYNQNVGGASGRHPFGTAIDVQFCSKDDQEKAHVQLCKMRKQGYLRALGYYSGTSLHLGVGDSLANTWGKSCPL